MTEMEQFIEKYSQLLAVNKSLSHTEAERRAGEFLYALTKLIDWKHILTNEKIRLLSIQTATYASEMHKGKAKTMTENKLSAEASEEYIKVREDLEKIENDISYLKAYYDIFTNGHLFYRQMCKEGQQLL